MAASTALTDVVFDTGTATMSPKFKTGDTVFLKTELTGVANQDFIYNPYTVKYIMLKTTTGGAYVQVDGTTAADSDGVLDYDTTNVDGSGTPNTGDEVPYLYYIQNNATSKNSIVHESKLKTLAGANATRDAWNWS